MDWLLGRLRQAGFPPPLAFHAYHILDARILGFTSGKKATRSTRTSWRTFATDFLPTLPLDQYPHFVEHAHQHLSRAEGTDINAFEFGLDLILDGLERLRQTA